MKDLFMIGFKIYRTVFHKIYKFSSRYCNNYYSHNTYFDADYIKLVSMQAKSTDDHLRFKNDNT